MTWVYILSDSCDGFDLYTVGFYRPDGSWEPESDHETKESAAARCHYLNGGKDHDRTN